MAKHPFAEYVSPEPNSGCWLWTGGVTDDGYGLFRNELAHRVSLRLAGVDISDHLVTDHLCRNPCCVNPKHLEPVTQRVNVLRGIGPSALAAKQTHCVNGHPLEGPNLGHRTRRNGERVCKECKRQSDAKNYENRLRAGGSFRQRPYYRHLDQNGKEAISSLLSRGFTHASIERLTGYSIATISNVRNGKHKKGNTTK